MERDARDPASLDPDRRQDPADADPLAQPRLAGAALCDRPGLGTSPIPIGAEIFEIEFDFVGHRLSVRTSRGAERSLPLRPQSVADFYRATIDLLASMGVAVAIKETPNEVPNPIRFSEDRIHASYDAAAAHRFWRALVQADRVFKLFRSGFLGKASPVHFFWGSFDLAVTRFSGRRAPLHPGGVPGLPDAVVREAYSHEVSSAGFWPGAEAFPRAAFYSYAYPEPAGFRDRPVAPGSYFDTTLGEFILPYDTVAQARQPDALLLDFLSTTYVAAARPAAGTAPRWNARLGFRDGSARYRREQMVAWERVTRADVLHAIKEYDRLGPERFFSEHGFAPTTTYELAWEEHRYPPKAILGTAYEFATGERLGSSDFEGGKTGAVRVLGQLGFTVQEKRRPARKSAT